LAQTLGPPAGALGVKSGSRIVISWNPEPNAKEDEIGISTTDTFSSTIESHRIDQASWAPEVNLTLPANRATLFLARDSHRQPGQRRTVSNGGFVPPRRAVRCTVVKTKKTAKKKAAKKWLTSAHRHKKAPLAL
jgi:hypothetical protein